MKKLNSFVLTLITVLMLSVMTSCSNDNPDNPSQNNNLYGRWNAYMMDWGDGWEYPYVSGKFIQFNSNGTGTGSFDPDDNDFCEFRYTINGSTIKIIGTMNFYGEREDFTMDAYIVNLTKNSLELQFYVYDWEESFVYKYSR